MRAYRRVDVEKTASGTEEGSMTPILFGQQKGDCQQNLAQIVEMMREMSRQTHPQRMVRSYNQRASLLLPSDPK